MASSTRWSRNAVGWAVAGSVLVVAGGIVLGVRASDSVEASEGCNGHVELCGRPLDQVVFAGSHNSMSSTDLGWDLAMQTGDIVEQLDLGVRALLIDTHYWDDAGAVEGGDDAAAAAVIEAALADDEPQPGTWLCHGFCGLGATDFEAALSEIKLWMDANPREVVMLGIQDEISTQDTVEAFEASGLLDIVHRHEPSSPWPTLEDLIDLDERVLVYAENEGEPSSWYQNAWEETITDTPFKFALKSEFSCDANRGQPENPLFLINHWLTTGVPVREAAEAVNEIDELRSRVDQCRESRGREPNIIAVDFVEVGDLITFVDELNGVEVTE